MSEVSNVGVSNVEEIKRHGIKRLGIKCHRTIFVIPWSLTLGNLKLIIQKKTLATIEVASMLVTLKKLCPELKFNNFL